MVAISLLATGLLVCSLLVFPSWGPQYAEWLTAPEQHVTSDAIFVLGGETQERTKTAIGLYQEGIAPHIYITGDTNDVLADADDSSKQARDLAISSSVDPEAITLLMTTSTLEDAQAIHQVVQENHINTITVVTNWYHSRRAICTIRSTLKNTGVSSVFVGATTDNITQQNWWENSSGLSQGLSEIPKILLYALIYRVPVSDCWPGDWQITPFALSGVMGMALSIMLVVSVRRRALSKNILDIPNDRSSHASPTPSGGGLGIVVSVLIVVIVGLIWNGVAEFTIVLPYLVLGSAVAVLGWRDDQSNLSALLRLALHALIALLFLLLIPANSTVYLPIMGDIILPPIIIFVIRMFIIIGLINTYNFMDGIDGIAAMQAIIACMGWLVLFLVNNEISLTLVALALIVATIGFLYWNFPPALIFMGDVGSTFLGFTMAVLPLMGAADGANMPSRLLITGLLFVAPFLFDSTLTIIRRWLNGENILLSHRSHLYQRLTKIGYSHFQVTTLYTGLFILSALCGIIFYGGEAIIGLMAIIVLLFVLMVLALGVTLLERKQMEAVRM